jgi:hypothetical protein
MILVSASCPFCNHDDDFGLNYLHDKGTFLCSPCRRPIEVYRDGRAEISALYYVTGHMYLSEGRRVLNLRITQDIDNGLEAIPGEEEYAGCDDRAGYLV